MKKVILLVLILVMVFPNVSVSAAPEIESRAAILMDAQTGQILYSKNQDEVLYPASITKIMTIYLGTQDESKLDNYYSASDEAIKAVPRDTSNIALDFGEEIKLKDALHAAMLMSANDACNLIAEAVSGNMDKFVKLMNSTAKTFGARNTSFANANGLTDKKHYTTAYDFAVITKEALKSEAFKKVFFSMDYTIPPTNKNDEERNFVAQHRMMHQAKYNHLGVVGGKNGFTSEASYTLVTYGKKDGKELICVILKSPSFTSVYEDTETLLEYGYKNFTRSIMKAEEVEEYIDGRTTYTPVGEAEFLLDNQYEKGCLVTAFADGEFQIKTPDGTVLGTLEATSETRLSIWQIILNTALIIFFSLLGIIIILYVLLIISSNKSRKRRKKK
jgi:D-alanyl-D-alanine carboxypeptidase